MNKSSIAFTLQLFLDILLTEIRGKSISYRAFIKKNTMRKKADFEKEILHLEHSLNSENSATLAEKKPRAWKYDKIIKRKTYKIKSEIDRWGRKTYKILFWIGI